VNDHIFPLFMLIIGVIVAGLVAAMPQASLDVLTWRLWLPQILPAAIPPIGATGRTLLALGALVPFVAVAALAWRLRSRAVTVRRRTEIVEHAPTIRRADAHPDCPPRRPIRAEEDLGPPLPIVATAPARRVEEEQPLPSDLDQPLAAFDPVSIPEVPRETVRAVPPLAMVVVPAREQDEDVTPHREPAAAEQPSSITPPPPAPLPEQQDVQQEASIVPAESASLSTLLDRLERGARRRAVPESLPEPEPTVPAGSLDDTLVMLRRMARP
jgi:hypothetical protein